MADDPSQDPRGWWSRVFGSNWAKATAEERIKSLTDELSRVHEQLWQQHALIDDLQTKARQTELQTASYEALERRRTTEARQASEVISRTEHALHNAKAELSAAVRANEELTSERDAARQRVRVLQKEKSTLSKQYRVLLGAQTRTREELDQTRQEVGVHARRRADAEREMLRAREAHESARQDLTRAARKAVESAEAATRASAHVEVLERENEKALEALDDARVARAQSGRAHEDATRTAATLGHLLERSLRLIAHFAEAWVGPATPVALKSTPDVQQPTAAEAKAYRAAVAAHTRLRRSPGTEPTYLDDVLDRLLGDTDLSSGTPPSTIVNLKKTSS